MCQKQIQFIQSFLVVPLYAVLFLLNSCINENIDDCPPTTNENLIIHYRYVNNEGHDIFLKAIHKVDVFIFDQKGRLVLKKTTDQKELASFAGTKLKLPPGKYRIVCWGNTFDKTEYKGIETGQTFEKIFLSNTSLTEKAVAVNGDPLHYAPSKIGHNSEFIITVPETGLTTAIMPFSSAHIRIEVYVKGLQDTSSQGDLLPPVVELTEIPNYYDFNRQTFGSFISYQDTSSYKESEVKNLATIIFHTPLFTIETPTQVLIKKTSENKVIANINLRNFIKENKIDINETTQTVIPILVKYGHASVVVSVPEWIQKPTKPEL